MPEVTAVLSCGYDSWCQKWQQRYRVNVVVGARCNNNVVMLLKRVGAHSGSSGYDGRC